MRINTSIMTAALAVLGAFALPVAAQQQQAYRAPRTADGKPNLNGIWQAMNVANWDLEGHAAGMPAKEVLGILGAQFAVPPGLSVIDGDGMIPYLPAALQKRKDNFANRVKNDPEVKCYMPGVP